MGVSLLTILPLFLFFGFIGAILFIHHESPKYDFDVDEFVMKYNPNYVPQDMNPLKGDNNGFIRNDLEVKVDSL